MTTPHPNADLLRDIADGRQTQKEILDGASRRFVNCSAKRALQMIAKGCAQFIRIKPETVLINGIECNAPMRVEPEMGSWYYAPTPTREVKFIRWSWSNDASDQRFFAEGLCFATAEDAAAAAWAMIAPLKGGAE